MRSLCFVKKGQDPLVQGLRTLSAWVLASLVAFESNLVDSVEHEFCNFATLHLCSRFCKDSGGRRVNRSSGLLSCKIHVLIEFCNAENQTKQVMITLVWLYGYIGTVN